MANERKTTPEEAYGLTEREQLYDRLSHERFQEVISDLETTVHQMQVLANNYGEFLFVTSSRTVDDSHYRLTFWGMGYHEFRERWISEEWFWYRGYKNPDVDAQKLSKDDVLELLQQRAQEIPAQTASSQQTKRGQLFEMLADLTDDDGAVSELQDLHDLLDDFDDD